MSVLTLVLIGEFKKKLRYLKINSWFHRVIDLEKFVHINKFAMIY